MGGIVDGGVGIGIKTSPRRAAIEKAQAELRQEYDVREKRRRELEFLEKGGNPLDFKFGNAASVSGQSASPIDRHPEQFVSCEAKGSFALTASPHGDSIESSGRPGAPPVCEPNSADNLLLFDSENELPEGSKKSIRADRKNFIMPSVQSSQMDGSRSAKDSEESAIFRPYARRNRSRLNRDGARLNTAEALHSRGSHGSSIPARAGIKDSRGSTLASINLKEQNVRIGAKGECASTNGDLVSNVTPDNRLNVEVDDSQALGSSGSLKQIGSVEGKLDIETKISRDEQHNQSLQADGQETPGDVGCGGENLIREGENISSDSLDRRPSIATERDKDKISQLNNSAELKGNDKPISNEVQKSSTAFSTKCLESESSSAPLMAEVKTDVMSIDSGGKVGAGNSEHESTQKLTVAEMVAEQMDEKTSKGNAVLKDEQNSSHQNHVDDALIDGVEENHNSRCDLQKKESHSSSIDNVDLAEVDPEREGTKFTVSDPNASQEKCSARGSQESVDLSPSEIQKSSQLEMGVAAPTQLQVPCNRLRLEDKAYEDSILEEARVIEAKRKRIAELSVGTVAPERRQKSHWDFVLEEMAWLANDFAQERLWKMTAAAQLCRHAASSSHLRFDRQSQQMKLRKVAYTLAEAVMHFWHSAEELLNNEGECLSLDLGGIQQELDCSRQNGGNEVSEGKTGDSVVKCQGSSNELPSGSARKRKITVQGYAVRFLQQNNSHAPLLAEAPKTPDKICEMDSLDLSWENNLTEESLFYAIPSCAMENYRNSIESYVTRLERNGSNIQEVEKSTFDVAEYGYQENLYNEDEGETSTYYLPGAFEGSKSLKFAQKKRKNPTRSYEVDAELPYGRYSIGSQQPPMIGKRTSNLVGPIPTKRFRSASRPRVLMPSNAGGSMGIHPPMKTDASSGDTSSFQDDVTTLQGASRMPKSMEVDSVADFEKQLSYDLGETSMKTKKKKKAKNMSSPFEQGWQLDSAMLSEQSNQSKKRLENHQFDSNGTSGLYGQHNAKKQKMKHSLENTFDNIMPMTGSIPSSMASQSISNQNKFMKYISGRDRSKKAKLLKTPSMQPGSGSPWSLFEDQALVVLVHDMGPNWELVSDAINSILQFKCIFRKPRECKERHKLLMDKTAGDGADSAEDSGSSQSYPSTLPGIPKGSARQLFQRLQGPVEEDTIREHFDKIIQIGQKHRQRRIQNENQDPKQLTGHTSHFVALSQVCPNNLNGVLLTPLDLCEETSSNTDFLPVGYQVPHGGNLAMSNQGAVASMLPVSGVYPPVQVSGGMGMGTNLLSPSGPLNASLRDGRYNVQRPSPLPADEQHRMQQHNQTQSSRNIQQSNLSIPGNISGNNRARMLSNGNGMGMSSAMNRNIPMSRPGFQGLAASSALNPNNMLSSGMVGVPSPVNMHSGSSSAQGTSMLRPREGMHMVRPGHNLEQQRQMMLPELQMQAAQGNSQGIPPINGLGGSAFSNQMTPPPAQSYPGHTQQQHQMAPQQSHAPNHPQNHVAGSQQQAYAIRFAKERQQRYMQQHQQQLAASGSLMPHMQSQSQVPMSPSLQNSPQIQPRPSSQSVPISPLTPASSMNPMPPQNPQKHQMPPHGPSRNPQTNVGGMSNQMGKQRQRQLQQQQFQQSGRSHPQQRQPSQAQQQAKIVKGIGRGNMVQQSMPAEPSQLNGLSAAPGSLGGEKEFGRGQGLYSETCVNPVQSSKPLVSQSLNHYHLQQHLSPDPALPLSKQQQVPCHSDHATPVQIPPPVPPGQSATDSVQSAPSTLMASNHLEVQLQQQPRQKQANQSSPMPQRMIQQNRPNSQIDRVKGDQKPVNSTLQVGTTAVTSQASNDSANRATFTSSALPSQWKASEPGYDTGILHASSPKGSIVNSTLPNPVRNEPLTSQGVGQRQLSDSLTPKGDTVGGIVSEWQQQQTHLKQSSVPSPLPQLHYQTEEQPSQLEQRSPEEHPLRPQSQQQT
ncbi:chromatin modification-related protein EAF1 B [Syzygium oleosum]|uniref:chromatin modification-related protein EAF1 B n=1 Tax=Syzygium oleosum TaxID=219896 RepID=UPI0011D21E90|nr:chromatin modification-related protein EAF1 B [Syzygium oleosum]